ncbi:MAG: zinc ABC transporter substrate-binding protein [Gammaproteobacteria bacterium]|nr:zinc ABC transporter substrate-binding protein [Gammaproteobacteria bacterium]
MAKLITFLTGVRSLPTAILALLAVNIQAADQPQVTILTGNQATYSLASALTRETPIQVLNVPQDGRQMSLLKDYIGRRTEALSPTFAAATAVISVTNALPGDPIYRFARDANIRIVDIDAASPWSLSTAGVALTDTPVSNVDWGTDTDPVSSATAPYFWLSLSNAIRMGDIIAHDLVELFPDSETAIQKNLDELKWSLLNLRNEYQNRLIEAGDDTVFALTGDFVYLTNDMGLYVDGYFIKQDIRWTEADLESLTNHLEQRDIRVVIHKWMPSDAIQAAVSDAGARLVVLDSGDPGMVEDRQLVADGLQQILRKNLDAIHSALSQ